MFSFHAWEISIRQLGIRFLASYILKKKGHVYLDKSNIRPTLRWKKTSAQEGGKFAMFFDKSLLQKIFSSKK